TLTPEAVARVLPDSALGELTDLLDQRSTARLEEVGEPGRALLVERHRSLRLAGLVPDAEAHMPLGRSVAEVVRDAKGGAGFVVERRVRAEELDDLAALRGRAPGAVAEPPLVLAPTLAANSHRRNRGYYSRCRTINPRPVPSFGAARPASRRRRGRPPGLLRARGRRGGDGARPRPVPRPRCVHGAPGEDPGRRRRRHQDGGRGREVAGYVLSFARDGRREVGYRLGREHWGRGIAT